MALYASNARILEEEIDKLMMTKNTCYRFNTLVTASYLKKAQDVNKSGVFIKREESKQSDVTSHSTDSGQLVDEVAGSVFRGQRQNLDQEARSTNITAYKQVLVNGCGLHIVKFLRAATPLSVFHE